MEEQSDLVLIGKLIDEHSYKRENKHINIDNTINIDFIGHNGTLHEVKKSNQMENADIAQLKYYLYFLHKRGVENLNGLIDYPKLKQRVNVQLSPNDIPEIEKQMTAIETIVCQNIPPPIKKTKICKQCSYFELCFI